MLSCRRWCGRLGDSLAAQSSPCGVTWSSSKLPRTRPGQGHPSRCAKATRLLVHGLLTLGPPSCSPPPSLYQVQFQVPMFTASGLHVRSLKVFEKSQYQTTKWVRYITKAGQYQIRI